MQIPRIDLIDTYDLYFKSELIKPRKVVLEDNNKIEPKHEQILNYNEFELSAKIFNFNLETLLFEHIYEHNHPANNDIFSEYKK